VALATGNCGTAITQNVRNTALQPPLALGIISSQSMRFTSMKSLQPQRRRQSKRTYLYRLASSSLKGSNRKGQRVWTYLKAAADTATVRRALLRLIVRHDLPLTLPTWNETHTLVHSINYMASGTLWHAHSTTAYQILQVFEVKRQQLKQQLQRSQSRIHITTDTWHSPNHKEFQAVTAHWLGADNKLHKALISLPEMEAGHAGVKVTEKLLTVLDNYSLKDQLGYITA